MKLQLLFAAVVLGMAVHVHAQNTPAPSAPKAASVSKDPNMNADGSVTLAAGVLKDVVAEIERRIGHWTPIEGGESVAMPNLLYSADASNAEVPGDLRLRGVSPLQAVAFAAAAAGCTLEPIFAPRETPGASPQKAIGYRVARVSAFTRLHSPLGPLEQPLSELDPQISSLAAMLGKNHPVAVREHLKQLMSIEPPVGVGLALAKSNGSIVVGQILPGSPASYSSAIRPGQRILRVADGDQEDVDVTGLGLEKVVQMIRGAPGTVVRITLGGDSDKGPTENVVTLVRESLPVKASEEIVPTVKVVNPPGIEPQTSNLYGGGHSSGVKPGRAISGIPSTQSARGNEPLVRVYPIGYIMTGTKQEQQANVENLDDLIRTSLNMAKLDLNPDLNVHVKTGILMSKATAAQHEIIEQVVQALRENATRLATPAKP